MAAAAHRFDETRPYLGYSFTSSPEAHRDDVFANFRIDFRPFQGHKLWQFSALGLRVVYGCPVQK